MKEKAPNLVTSGLSGFVTKEGTSLDVCIYRLEHQAAWTLEVVTSDGTSVVWDDPFESDDAAFAEFEKTIDEIGVAGLLNEGNIIQFPNRS